MYLFAYAIYMLYYGRHKYYVGIGIGSSSSSSNRIVVAHRHVVGVME